MPVLVPSKLKQMGMDKAYKIVDAVDVELTGGSDVQTFVDNFASTLADYVTVKDGDFGTQGQYAISNADGTISFTSSSSAVDPDLITEDGVKFRFGRNSVGEFGYIITTEEGDDQLIPFKKGDGGEGDAVIVSLFNVKWQPHTFGWDTIVVDVGDEEVILAPYVDKTIDEEDD